MALSTTEAEYIAVNEAGKELLWLKLFLMEMGVSQEVYELNCDSQSAIELSKNATYHPRTKHIKVRYHWIRDAMEEGELSLVKIHTSKNPADMLTKMVNKNKHELCCELIGVT